VRKTVLSEFFRSVAVGFAIGMATLVAFFAVAFLMFLIF
jgi:hypothetical protein